MNYTYHSMAMHLHCCHQLGASMESHMHNAAALGMHYIRFTPHDNRTGPKKVPCNSFDFSRGELVIEDYPRCTCGWEEVYGEPQVLFDDGKMIISASEDGEAPTASGYGFKSSGKRHTVSIMAETALTLGFEFEAVGEARLVLDVRLSQRAPDHEPAHLRYVIGGLWGTDIPHAVEIPLEVSDTGIYTLDLTADVQRDGIKEIVGGLDNAFDNISVLIESKNGGKGTVKLHKFEIRSLHGFNDVIVRQREVAEEVGKRYGIKPFVTTEISAAGNHKNCFDTRVPVINYAERGYNVTQAEAIEHVKKYGGIFSYNHPFEHMKRVNVSPEEKAFIVYRAAASFVSSKVWGATLMEVDFVDGRAGFGLREHLMLWDLIGLGGVFITGYGDSDSHKSSSGWFSGQNSASWIAAPSDIPFPVPETEFIESMKAGRVYMGDPVFLKSPVDLTCEGKPMGAVIEIADRDKDSRTVKFTAFSPDMGNTLRVMINGEEVKELKVCDIADENGNVNFEFEVKPSLPINLARVEMYNADGRCIMLTNPIYFVRTAEYAGEIPSERLY